MPDRAGDTLAQVTLAVAVAQLDRLALASGSAGGRRGSADDAAFQRDLGFNGGITARVQDFPA
jgi:hypothetical protein